LSSNQYVKEQKLVTTIFAPNCYKLYMLISHFLFYFLFFFFVPFITSLHVTLDVIKTCRCYNYNFLQFFLQFFLFSRCVQPQDDSVVLLENGMGTNARFKFNMFKWRTKTSYIYMHCEVYLCDVDKEECSRSEVSSKIANNLDIFENQKWWENY